jgi:hypothetical protein
MLDDGVVKMFEGKHPRSIAIAYAKNPKIRNFAFGDLSQLRACFPAKLGDLEIPYIRVGLI